MKTKKPQDIKSRSFKVRWWATLSFNWILSLLGAPEVWCLLGIMVILFGISWACSGSGSNAFRYLFDAGLAAEHFWTGVAFFTTWLVGGGVLVSVMISQFYRNIGGYFRRWTWFVRNHIVVLGWDDGMLMEVKKAADDNSADCYIITQQDVITLRKSLKSAGLDRVILYKGDYDNEHEWRDKLCVDRAKSVFIAGESDEKAHDARVKLLFEKVAMVVPSSKIKVNIHDFGLAWKLHAAHGDVFENFHLKWANALWAALSSMNKWNDEKKLSKLDVIIVGFGAMGKAVAITVPGKFAVSTLVTVTDDDDKKVAEEYGRYTNQFASGNYVNGAPIKWSDALTMIKNGNTEEGSTRVIIVAKKRSEKGMLCMMDIISQLGENMHRNDVLVLSQEIEGCDAKTIFATMKVGKADVLLFGMKNGCCADNQWLPDIYRNPNSKRLVEYANQCGKDLVARCGIPGARFALGGALGYDAALKDSYDIDLRLLLPDCPNVEKQIDGVRDLLVNDASGDATFATRFIDEGGTNYIQHTKRMVQVPGISADVELSWNIQSAKSYRSIAEMAARLPHDLIDSFVVAKWNARAEGEETYKAVKLAWRRFIEDLIDRDAGKMSDEELLNLLKSLRMTFPSFLTGSVS